MSRRFALIREQDVSGISGTGRVAEGIEFEDGTIAMRWLTSYRSTCIYDDAVALDHIHGHNGSTRIEWQDD